MAGQEKATRRHGEGGGERRPLAFIDHHRQDYAERVPMPHEGEFLIGDYLEGGGSVGDLGEFKVAPAPAGLQARNARPAAMRVR